MASIDETVATALNDFRKAALLADAEFVADAISIEITTKPHKSPTKLPGSKWRSTLSF